ncbi:AAA family ATPase [Gaiella sp.]|uniref:AAA family ATPase n=1 Tax=Gaiella sp. TaxID=2663207 RepID=UPI002C6C6072|nr:adenylate/guanylate cyclase domain-containing protein [Gaiella sp.]HWO81860.1 adenylate/guanylate cyclase domain-containing protein [Gaiella sp.]
MAVTCPSCGSEVPAVARFCMNCGAALTPAAPERWKLATLVFCDLSGSTAMGERLDAEAVRTLMLSYFHEMRGALERHGGTVEKFVGDAVLAVFGVPEAHEDDALRACRAALEMQARLGTLNEELEQRFGTRIALRIGVNTGEVVAGDASTRETFVTGDPVNVAARLEQAAGPGEVLLGEPTFRLVRNAVRATAVEPLRAKGKSEPVPAYRLLEVSGFGPVVRPTRTPFAGRAEHLDVLEQAFEAVVASRAGRLATVVGEPGVGKSRLVAELVSRIGARARVVRGTCLSYGEGITYWAVGQIARELAGVRDEHSPDEVLRRLEAHAARTNDPHSVAAHVGQLLGIAGGSATAEETARSIAEFLAAGAGERPLMVVVDDIQWAEQTLLDLLEGLPASLSAAPVLVLALTRPELLERRGDWPATVRLEPLGAQDLEDILDALLGQAPAVVRARLAAASGGNPLFLEELVAMLRDDGVLESGNGDGKVPDDLAALALPTSLSALLGARLDSLDSRVRATLERGSVEGEVFHRGAVVALVELPARSTVHADLETLSVKDFVRPAEASFAGEAAYRFKHLLVRDAAYQGTAKRLRAVLHAQFADWLEDMVGARLAEHEEILGYHLEQSYRYRTELGPPDAEIRALGARAAERLAAAGERASRRGDIDAASGLFGRASRLLPAGDPARAHVLVQLVEALMDAGLNPAALQALDELESAAIVDEVTRAHAVLCRGEIELQLASTTRAVEHLHALARAGIELFAEHDDDQALLRACWVSYLTSMTTGHSRAAGEAIDRLGVLADRLSHPLAGRLPGMRAMNLAWGPTPVPEALEATGALLREVQDDPATEPFVLAGHAYLLAQARDIVSARAALTRMREIAERQGQRLVLWASWGQNVGRTELLAGDPERAEAALRPSWEALRDAGSLAFSSTLAGQLGHALVELGRADEGAAFAEIARDAAGEADVLSQVLWRSALARALALQGNGEHPRSLADEAVALAASTEWPNVLADTLIDRARVAMLAGDPARAEEDVERATVIYVAKGNTAGHARATVLATRPRPDGQLTNRQGGPP